MSEHSAITQEEKTPMTRPAVLAHVAAERIRELNRITEEGPAYRYASEVDLTIGVLERLVDHLPQALDQAAGWLQAAQESGALGTQEPGRSSAETTERAVRLLDAAMVTAADLAEYLALTRTATVHLTTHTTIPISPITVPREG